MTDLALKVAGSSLLALLFCGAVSLVWSGEYKNWKEAVEKFCSTFVGPFAGLILLFSTMTLVWMAT